MRNKRRRCGVLAALLALMRWKWPPWGVVAACAALGWAVDLVPL